MQSQIEFEVVDNLSAKAASKYFCVIQEEAEEANNALFSVLLHLGMNEQEREKKYYAAPVRLGEVCDEIIYHTKQSEIKKSLKPIKIGPFMLLPQKNIMEDQKEKSSVKVTDKEMDILLYLFRQSPNKVTRTDMLHNIWRYSESIETHTLETHIYRLRQKIETNPAEPKILMTDDEGYYLQL